MYSPWPSDMLSRSRVHGSVVAYIAAQHFCEHQPYFRIKEAWGVASAMVENREGGQLVMRDCISLEMACKEFWIFSPRSILENGTLSEGVIAELLLWKRWKPDGEIRLFDLERN